MRRREFLVGAAAGLIGRGCGGSRVLVGDGGPQDSGGGVDAGRDAGGGVDAGFDAGTDAGPIVCDDPALGSELLQVVPFIDTVLPLDVPQGDGESKRLYRDLSLVTQETLVTPADLFYIRTGFPPEIDAGAFAASWRLSMTGQVSEERTFTLADLLAEEREMGVRSLECSGNFSDAGFGLLSSARWSGVPIETVLSWVDPYPDTRVHFKGINRYAPLNPALHTSWIYSVEDLVDAGAFLATAMNGKALPIDHGRPCRLMVPGWYGCCNTKWLTEIAFVADDVPASEQMLEYRTRTHQPDGVTLARDFIPSVIDIAAVASRVEKRLRDGEVYYLVHGILWGGTDRVTELVLVTNDGEIPATICPPHTDNDTWALWWAEWRPKAPGTYRLKCRVEEIWQRQRRLESGFYERPIVIAEV